MTFASGVYVHVLAFHVSLFFCSWFPFPIETEVIKVLQLCAETFPLKQVSWQCLLKIFSAFLTEALRALQFNHKLKQTTQTSPSRCWWGYLVPFYYANHPQARLKINPAVCNPCPPGGWFILESFSVVEKQLLLSKAFRYERKSLLPFAFRCKYSSFSLCTHCFALFLSLSLSLSLSFFSLSYSTHDENKSTKHNCAPAHNLAGKRTLAQHSTSIFLVRSFAR